MAVNRIQITTKEKQMTIRDNEIHGTSYYTASRYDYTAIDCTIGNSSGCETVITGIKPKKLAVNFCQVLQHTQQDNLLALTMANFMGGTANSNNLYLTATSDGDTYHKYFRDCLVQLKVVLDTVEHSRQAQDLHNIIWRLDAAFSETIKKYIRDFPEDSKYINWTMLDKYQCINRWLEANKTEWECNKLAGYEK